jgi:UDP-N-acetylmuramate: L-alanyl-gamma-D-glutamyl-meso-diaminopimelate ligase
VEQFQIFVDSMTNGGAMVYNTEDENVVKVVENATAHIKKYPYQTPEYTVEDGETLLETPDGAMPIEVFGKHNLNNLAGAKWICQHMGVVEEDFYEAISTFTGASKRLELIAKSKDTVIYKDFAHSPSKVAATTSAVKEQYGDRTVVACLELHTYSSLNPEFLSEYQGALDAADVAVVFYSPKAVEIKKLEPITAQQIAAAFKRDDLTIFTDPADFKAFLFEQELKNKAILLMSSGNYGGLDFEEVKGLV